VADGVVSHNETPRPRTAGGVVAKAIKGLRAQRAGKFRGQHSDSETVGYRASKVAWAKDSVEAVHVRRNSSDEGPSVRLSDTKQALLLSLGRTVVDEETMCLLIVSESLCCPLNFPALCARKPLIALATTPPAVRGQGVSLCDTTPSATWSIASRRMVRCSL